MAENRGGFRPTAPQNNPANVSGTGGAGQSGTQPARYISGLNYGQGQETMQQQTTQFINDSLQKENLFILFCYLLLFMLIIFFLIQKKCC